MRPDSQLLKDVLEAIAVVEQYTPGSEDEFNQNPPVQSHVLRHVQIIGEASARLSRNVKDQNPHIPWKQIIGMRNITIHAYSSINWRRVYPTARDDVPLLKPQIEAVLASLPPTP